MKYFHLFTILRLYLILLIKLVRRCTLTPDEAISIDALVFFHMRPLMREVCLKRGKNEHGIIDRFAHHLSDHDDDQ